MTRLVRKPRESFTRIGVLPSCPDRSIAAAIVSSDVRSARITSTSFMRSAGEKKCMPTNRRGRMLASASPVMGSVDVLDARNAFSPMAASALAITSALTARSSNTASMTSSQPASAAKSVVGEIRRSARSRSVPVIRPWATRLSKTLSPYAFPAFARSGVVSSNTTSRPAPAAAQAIPAPIMPAPRTPIRAKVRGAIPPGRRLSRRASPMPRNSDRIMFWAASPAATRANRRASIFSPVSIAT